MRHTDGGHFWNRESSRGWRLRALFLATPRARLALAACAALLAAFAWAVVNIGRAEAQHAAANARLRAASTGEALLTGGEEEQGQGHFGASVALSADGGTAIVGAPWDSGRLGAAWVYTRSGAGWAQQGAKLTPEGEAASPICEEEGEAACGFGRSVALSANGDVAIVGSPRNAELQGSAWVYTRSGSTWTQSARLTGEGAIGEAHFGRSVALSGDGSIAVVGGAFDASGHGAVWVFTHASSGWTRTAKLFAPVQEGERNESFFGVSIALTRDGTLALIGAPGRAEATGAAWLFTRSGEHWSVDPAPLVGGTEEIGAGRFGYSVALSAEGTTALIGARTDDGRIGGAWAFAHNGNTWTPQKLVSGGEPEAFGFSVALSASGEDALVGAPSATAAGGRVWLFKRSGSKYSIAPTEITAHEAATGRLGASVALSQTGATALFGAPATNLRVGAALSLLGIPVAPPTVRSVAPNSGPSSGGTSVTLEGSGFLPGATVTIGGEATSVEVLSESKLTARTPAHAPGSDEVVVSDEYGTSSHGPSFTYFPQPIVTSVTPASGPTSGGTTITIEGSGFVAGVTTVTIGGVAASVTVISPSKLIATTAAAPAGSYEVVVSNGGTNSSGGPSFTYEPANFGLTSLITSGGSTQVLGNTTSQTPQPVLGVSGDISPVSGKVYVRLPGSKKFVLLTGLLNVPFGTIVDAREGTVAVTTQGKKGLQTVNLYEGAFVLSQGSNGVVTATLYGGNFGVCPTKRERAHKAASASARRRSRSHVVRKLWANGHGTYTTKGNYATGAVLGTVWETIDRCSGTGIHVVTDSVLVTNLVTHKKVRVKAGHTYIAKAP